MKASKAAVADGPGAGTLGQLTDMLREVTGEDAGWAGRITPQTRLEDDLRLESVELAALAELMRRRYGTAADLSAFLAELDLDQLIALTVGDLLAFLAETTRRAP